jgi:hypothetical protein
MLLIDAANAIGSHPNGWWRDRSGAAIAQAHRDVVVVTADRGLAERVRATDAEVVGPKWLLERLAD